MFQSLLAHLAVVQDEGHNSQDAEQQPNHSVLWDLQELYHLTGQLSHVEITSSKNNQVKLGSQRWG